LLFLYATLLISTLLTGCVEDEEHSLSRVFLLLSGDGTLWEVSPELDGARPVGDLPASLWGLDVDEVGMVLSLQTGNAACLGKVSPVTLHFNCLWEGPLYTSSRSVARLPGSLAAVLTGDGLTLNIISLQSGALVNSLTTGTPPLQDVCALQVSLTSRNGIFLRAGDLLGLGRSDGSTTALYFLPVSGAPPQYLLEIPPVECITIPRFGRELYAYGATDGVIYRLDLQELEVQAHELPEHPLTARGFCYLE
jgi:hypothetical protein